MKQNDASPRIDPGLFFLRLTGSLLLLYVHGLPKVLHFSEELTRIEDPFGFGPYASLIPAIVAEVICPLFIIAGFTPARRACRLSPCCWWRCWRSTRTGRLPRGSLAGCC